MANMKSRIFNFWTVCAGLLGLFITVIAVTIFVGNRLIGTSQSELAGVGYVAAFLGAGVKSLMYCSPIVFGVPLVFSSQTSFRVLGVVVCAGAVTTAVFIARGT